LALARDGLYVGIGVRSNAGLLDDITTFEVDPEHFSGANTAMQVPDRVQMFLNSFSRLERSRLIDVVG
jgi:hypothetical protein